MDRFTRRYLTGLALLAAIGAIWWVSNLDGRVSALNSQLADDPYLSDYPYEFRVLAIENGVARMSSPRSADMSAIQGLRIMYPELRDESAVSDRMMTAQEDLARHQSYAGKQVTEHPDVKRVRWVLDERWLSENGVMIQ